VDRAVYRTDRHASMILFITTSMDNHDEEKRREQKLIVRSGKFKMEVANNRRLRSTYCVLLKLTTDRHKASRGISATAGLLIEKHDISSSSRT